MCDIWHKYHSWYFKIVSNFTRLMARQITYNNFEISLVIFMPNITTNHAITCTNNSCPLLQVIFLRIIFVPVVHENLNSKADYILFCFDARLEDWRNFMKTTFFKCRRTTLLDQWNAVFNRSRTFFTMDSWNCFLILESTQVSWLLLASVNALKMTWVDGRLMWKMKEITLCPM